MVDAVPEDAVRAKGRFGMVLEQRIGLNPFAPSSDFLDGELKTNMTHVDGTPKESIFICQIGNLIRSEGLLTPTPTPFDQSYLYKKINNMLIVPVVKVGLPPEQWYISGVYHIRAPIGSPLFLKFKADYDSICGQLYLALSKDVSAFIHTTNGPNYIQIRTKDGIPTTYKPMYCDYWKREISNKRFAFYFTRKLVLDYRAHKLI